MSQAERLRRCPIWRRYRRMAGVPEARLATVSLFLFSLLLAWSAAAPLAAQGRPEKERIRIGYAARAVTHSIPFLASEAGLFREEGLQVEVVRTAGAVSPMALISGDTDFATMSAYLLIPVSVRNRDVAMLAGLTRYASMTLVSRPEIRSAKDLAGAVIGLQRPGDAYEKNARAALQHLGLSPDRDVKFLYLGSNEAMWIALEARKVAATMVSPPATLFARKAGMNFLVNLSELKIEYQGSTFAARRSAMKSFPNLTLRAMRAMVRGIHFFKTRREDTLKILAKFLGTADREALEESWAYGAEMPSRPYPVESAVQAVIQHLAEGDPKFAGYKPADFIEPGPLAQLDRSGFIDRLYGAR
ncbi:MAG TPA: ABC transporter substrate-binding protein [candidate division Zixibacteria bacterium]|nr:ABC transporter substrate-binding protein [candidate division Zixibacteria bacterium]